MSENTESLVTKDFQLDSAQLEPHSSRCLKTNKK